MVIIAPEAEAEIETEDLNIVADAGTNLDTQFFFIKFIFFLFKKLLKFLIWVTLFFFSQQR
jgi:hypothetical protein